MLVALHIVLLLRIVLGLVAHLALLLALLILAMHVRRCQRGSLVRGVGVLTGLLQLVIGRSRVIGIVVQWHILVSMRYLVALIVIVVRLAVASAVAFD